MPPVLSTYDPPEEPLQILHQDNVLLVLNKPSGLLSVPGKSPEHADCLETRAKTQVDDALLVHRLDMETSGVFIMARGKHAQRHLGHQFERRRTQKTYLARVAGHMKEPEGRIDLPLICDWPNRPKQMVDHDNGKQAITNWTVLEVEPATTTLPGITKVVLSPETGRSHQLRVHMLAIGHPILGDRLYAPDAVLESADRLQLHAQTVTFMHPTRKELLTISAPAPF